MEKLYFCFSCINISLHSVLSLSLYLDKRYNCITEVRQLYYTNSAKREFPSVHFTHLFLSNLSINSKAIRFIEFSLIKKIMNWKIVNIIRHADWSYIFRIIHWDVNKILIRRTRRRKYIPWNTEYTHILNFLLIKELSNNLYLHDKLDKQYSDVILLTYIVRIFLFVSFCNAHRYVYWCV